MAPALSCLCDIFVSIIYFSHRRSAQIKKTPSAILLADVNKLLGTTILRTATHSLQDSQPEVQLDFGASPFVLFKGTLKKGLGSLPSLSSKGVIKYYFVPINYLPL